MGRDDPAGGSNLPAPYRNPWFALADDLRAALADLGLRVRELRRRNGDGSLWRPGWWPAGLAPLFWPLLLALTLAVLVGLALGSTQLLRHQPVPAPSTPDTALSRANEPVAASPDRVEPTAPDPEPAAPTPSLEASEASDPDAPPALADPLTALLAAPEAAGWIEAAQARADQGKVVLQLAPAYGRLPAAERQRLALLWQGMAAELGYEHLELRDSRAGLLGRDALVGEGMILFSPSLPT